MKRLFIIMFVGMFSVGMFAQTQNKENKKDDKGKIDTKPPKDKEDPKQKYEVKPSGETPHTSGGLNPEPKKEPKKEPSKNEPPKK